MDPMTQPTPPPQARDEQGKTPTPRTDAAVEHEFALATGFEYVEADFARQLERESAAQSQRITELEAALLPLMLLKSQHCDGQIGWRGQPKAIAGEIRVKDILRAERALDGTTIPEDAKVYTEHKWDEAHNAGVINRPQGPCDCEHCRRIRSLLSAPRRPEGTGGGQ